MKKILISTIASGMLASSLMAASSSIINLGVDVNGTVQDLAISSSTMDMNISDSVNFTTHANATKGITYTPAIGLGIGNLITVRISNGYVYDVSGNNLYLVDLNASAADKNTTASLVVAKMTDFVSSSDGKGYADMTFKFEQEVDSGQVLMLANSAETNSSLTTDGKKVANITSSGSTAGANLAVILNSGLSCNDWLSVSVVNSTDQSGATFDVANAPISTTNTTNEGIQVISALSLGKNVITAPTTTTTGDQSSASECPAWVCQIALPDEASFGATPASATCPTCTESTTPTVDCTSKFQIDYVAGTLGTNAAISTVDFTMTTTDTTGISSIKSSSNGGTTKATATLSGAVYSTSLSSTNGVSAATTNHAEIVTNTTAVDGTTVLVPRAFDLAVKVNTSVSVDNVTNYLKFTEAGTELKVSYMNASDAYRTFVRVTSDKTAKLQAIVTTEDGMVSDRVDITTSTGSAVEISAATGGAVVVEAADVLRSATDAGFAGTGNRFNATIYVKTTGTVDAVAYQTAGTSGSQRYLPVNGATGGKK